MSGNTWRPIIDDLLYIIIMSFLEFGIVIRTFAVLVDKVDHVANQILNNAH